MARKVARIKNESIGINKGHGIDLPFLVIFLVLLMLGLVMVFSASHANAYYQYGNSYYFISQQLKWAVLGGIAVFFTIRIASPKFLKKMAMPSLYVSVFLLVLVPFIGKTKYDATRWLEFGGVSIQPSEIAKIAVILSFAYLIVKAGDKIKTFKRGILPFVGILAVISVLLQRQPHYSAIIIILVVGFSMLIIGGVKLKGIVIAGAVAAAGVLFVITQTDYAKARIELWMDPFIDPLGKGFQTIQSLYAVGSGGLFGVGLGQSRQKYLYLPEPQNDFIFAIACEELGFIGAMIIVLLFVALVWRGLMIAFRAPDRFSALVISGIVIKTGLQAILNIAVVTNLLPNTGISLPFFSYGGSALLIQMVEMGIILSLSRFSKIQKL